MGELLNGKLNIAVDIGTSTISVFAAPIGVLYDDLNYTAEHTSVNSSKRFGSDIISRMEAAVSGDLSRITSMIRSDVRDLILSIIDPTASEGRILISCNTGILHLFLGIHPAGLLHSPFTPSVLSADTVCADGYFGPEFSKFSVSFVPCISAFVGGDIVSGLAASSFDCDNEINLLIDMGTNAEIAIGNSDLIYVASTAAGPAFESGNMECGTSYVRGALTGVGEAFVSDGFVGFKEVRVNGYDTFREVDARRVLPCTGICGSGYFELISRLLELGVIEPNGSFDEKFSAYLTDGCNGPLSRRLAVCMTEGGSIYISLADIRNFLLAKASVAAGVECLMQRYGASSDEIDKVFIGGAFCKAFGASGRVLPLPRELTSKIVTCSNTSLAGAYRMLSLPDGTSVANKIISVSRLFELAGNNVFEKKYIEAMTF